MKTKRPNKGFLLEGHRKPMTRRELLAQGFLGSFGYLAMPSLLELLARPAKALAGGSTLTCTDPLLATASSTRVPFIGVQLAGGPQPIFAQRLAGGGYMSAAAYAATHGEPTMPTFNTNTFKCPIKNGLIGAGTAWQRPRQEFLYGFLRESARINDPRVPTSESVPSTYLSAAQICTVTHDDTNAIAIDPSNIIASVTAAQYIPTILGDRNTPPLCGYYNGPIKNGTLTGMYVPNVTSIQSSFGFGPAIDSLTTNQKLSLLNTVKKLSEQELMRLAGNPGSAMCGQFMCALDARAASLSKTLNIDPREDATLRRIFGISQASAADSQEVVQALIVNSTLRHWASSGTLVIGGCDYHYKSRNQSSEKDQEIGELVARIVCTASALNTPVLIALMMDGSVSACAGDINWSADLNVNGASVALILFDPTRPPRCIQPANQLGYYTELNQRCSVDQTTFIGASPALAAYAIALNYVAVNDGADALVSSNGAFRRYITRTDYPDEWIARSVLFGY